MSHKIIFTDAYTLNPGDLDFSCLRNLGDFAAYDRSDNDNLTPDIKKAEILIVNKFRITEDVLAQMPELKYITVAATGYNNIDADSVRKRNIPVSNVSGYSTDSVAQHVFSFILSWYNKVEYYNSLVSQDQWSKSPDFCFYRHRILSVKNLTLGIYGYGSIGKRVGEIATSFGMNIIAYSRNPEKYTCEGIQFVSLEDLFYKSDILTLHAPLTDENRYIVNKKNLSLMRSSALLVNTARGGLVNEADLLDAITNQTISGACLDVLEQEPPSPGNPLLNHPRCIITPHIAWAGFEARKLLLSGLVQNIENFQKGLILNRVL